MLIIHHLVIRVNKKSAQWENLPPGALKSLTIRDSLEFRYRFKQCLDAELGIAFPILLLRCRDILPSTDDPNLQAGMLR